MPSDDVLDQYERASAWMVSKVPEAKHQLDAATPCVGWDVRTLLNHMLQTQEYFVGSARGDDDVSPPSPTPPDILSDDPEHDFEKGRAEMLRLFADDEVRQRTGPTLGIAFSDTLLHGWDLATATGQDATMPEDLPAAAYDAIHGRFTEEQRKGVFKPELSVGDDASPQERLLAYTGRKPG
jgi:uncharacterized protein (TIGR03086 family)